MCFFEILFLALTPILSPALLLPLLEGHRTAQFNCPAHNTTNLQPVLAKCLRVFFTRSSTANFAMLNKVGEGLVIL